MALNTQGIEELKLQLRRLANVPEIANNEMKACAEDLRNKARDMAPIDYGDLKGAIQTRANSVGGAAFRRGSTLLNYEVIINNNHPVSDDEKRKHGVTHVGEYAWLVHEYMGWGSTNGFLSDGRKFNPSDESRREGEKRGVEAGGKFLERAGLAMQDEINLRLARVVFKYIQGLDI